MSCTDFVFDRTEFPATLTTELDLVCDQEYKQHLLGTILMISLTFGSFFGGKLGTQMKLLFKNVPLCQFNIRILVDKYGRRFSLFLGLGTMQPLIILGGFVGGSYWLYAFVRFLACTVMVFGWVAAHTITVRLK